ncbi:hypothetical protein HYALB_00009022 [Hymenoscyphus albidus]|uniref:Uncharacterized protein n=1 Tax=Hymenoscyphus albidus TaxID=595503 RepID=A0A9N9M286_9HELO|nr:hypothetical protein HYALB_00009022 [Hymenoscyphus albidus]
MKEECRGGTACPKEWFLDTKIVAEATVGRKENKLYNAQIKIEALDASVQKGEINPLSTFASETFAYTQKMKPLKYWPTPKPTCGSRNPDCDPVRTPERIIDQWYGSKVIVINHRESKDHGSGIVSNLRFQISIVMPEYPTLASGDFICSGLLGAGGAIAGVVNPQLGITFALASLTCLFAA